MPSDKRKSVSQPRFIPSFLQTGRLLTAFYVSPTFYPVMDTIAVIINIQISSNLPNVTRHQIAGESDKKEDGGVPGGP